VSQWERIFRELSLDVSLIQPCRTIDFGTLETTIRKKRQEHQEVEMYQQHEQFIHPFRQKLVRWNNGGGA
jgi:hypothetical protein